MIVTDESKKRALEVRVFRKLAARERLLELAAAPGQEADPELATLKSYLAYWAATSEPAVLGGAAPHSVPYADLMRATASWDLDDGGCRLDATIRTEIERAVDEVSDQIPLARPVLMVRYMNKRGPAVYRSGRTVHLTRDEIEDLADECERRLVPIVKRRGVEL